MKVIVCLKNEAIPKSAFTLLLADPFDQVMCPSHNQIPHTDFERVDGWLTSNGAVHGTVLEYSCQVLTKWL